MGGYILAIPTNECYYSSGLGRPLRGNIGPRKHPRNPQPPTILWHSIEETAVWFENARMVDKDIRDTSGVGSIPCI